MTPQTIHTTIRASDALIRFAGFAHLPHETYRRSALVRQERDNARTFVRFSNNGDARIIRVAPGFRTRHVLQCGSWQYATDVERGVRDWADRLAQLQG